MDGCVLLTLWCGKFKEKWINLRFCQVRYQLRFSNVFWIGIWGVGKADLACYCWSKYAGSCLYPFQVPQHRPVRAVIQVATFPGEKKDTMELFQTQPPMRKHRLIFSLVLAWRDYCICSRSWESMSETKALLYILFRISYYTAYQCWAVWPLTSNNITSFFLHPFTASFYASTYSFFREVDISTSQGIWQFPR